TDAADWRAVMHAWTLRTGFAWKQRTRDRLWQEGYYDHIVRENDPVVGIVRYILNNPFRAGLVADGAAYRFSGSSRFTQEELRDARRASRPASTKQASLKTRLYFPTICGTSLLFSSQMLSMSSQS